MRVTFLGTGSAMPAGKRMQTGIAVQQDEQSILIDCGSGVLHRLEEYGPGYEEISTVLLTHHHLDHIADLMPLCKARWLSGEEDLTIIGGEGTKTLVDNLFEAHEYMQDRLDIEVREIEAGSHEIAGFNIQARETKHSLPCFAYRIGDFFAFSGDSEPFEELGTFFDEVAVVAHDCSFPDEVEVSNHPTPETLGKMLSKSNPEIGRLYLTHLYPHTEGKHEEMLDSLQGYIDTDVRIAEDGLSIQINKDP
ncbi:MBL fold metallo-hydrolase [Salinarchaeum sp. IM2453]|uniref:MBL fold metallo-hydrolase n=1 Tax=Salinarchaeum sp. IM2453 TaxID=2862870 RepID=UPI001C83B3DF|nr:MBL fold metallo-hydrolase [Salinarchaeum sp. IM2453]QZA87689.1 MBL fold metallo-hydrolase [Salinarchaeum sp. IM2453]